MLKTVGIATVTFGLGWVATSQFMARYYNFNQIKDSILQEYISLLISNAPSPDLALAAAMVVHKEHEINYNIKFINVVSGFFWIPYWILFAQGGILRIRNIHEWPEDDMQRLRNFLNN